MSIVRFYKDIGLDPSFKKTIDFTSKSAQEQWFNSKSSKRYDNVNYNKLQNILTINEDIDYSTALTYTYAVISQMEEDANRIYYCFIDNVVLNSPGRVEFELTLDPIQTFMCEFEIGDSMVTRKHTDRWSGNNLVKPYPQMEACAGEQEISKFGEIGNSDDQIAVIVFTNPKLARSSVDYDLGNNVFYGIIPVKTIDPTIEYNCKVQATITADGESSTIDYSGRYLTLEELTNGTFTGNGCIPSDGLISVSLINNSSIDIYDVEGSTYLIRAFAPNMDITLTTKGVPRATINKIQWMPYDGDLSGEFAPIIRIITAEEYQYITNKKYRTGDILLPTKPTNNVTADKKYEPALYMEPYTNRYITDGKGTVVFKIPDSVAMTTTTPYISVKNMFSSAGVTDYVFFGSADDNDMGKLSVISAAGEYVRPNIDVVSSAWQNYVLTTRDSDRKMVNDNNWRSALDNILFMGYGGALVGSRSASGTMDSDTRRNSLLKGGVAKAVPLAVGAAVATSVIDSHFAWEEQKAKESAIKNQPGNVVSNGNGLQQVLNRTSFYYLAITRANGDSLDIAYDTFRKYGYMINHFEKPNIRTRKYFDYILTNGATITGSLNADIKKALATIFDSGITIFHGDYVTTLEYPANENIERSLM